MGAFGRGMSGDVLATAGVRGLIVATGLASSIITARFLGPSGRGEYFFAIVLTTTVVQFANLGLQASNTYLVAEREKLLRSLAVNSFWIALAVGGGMGVAVALVLSQLEAFSSTPASHLWLGAALVVPILFFLLGTNLLVGVNQIRAYNAYEAGSRIIVLACLAGAGALALGVEGFLVASFVGWLVSSGALVIRLLRGDGGFGFDNEVFRVGLRFAAKTYVVALLGFLVLRGNVFLLRHYAAATEVGYYSIAVQIVDVLAIIPTSVALVLFPNLVRDRERSWAATRRSCLLVAAALIATCGAVAALAGPFIELVFGSSYSAAAPILRFMLPGVVAVGVTTIVSQYLAAHGLPRILLAIWAGAAVLTAVLGLLLIPSHGGTGAAIALTITYMIVALMVVFAGTRFHLTRETVT